MQGLETQQRLTQRARNGRNAGSLYHRKSLTQEPDTRHVHQLRSTNPVFTSEGKNRLRAINEYLERIVFQNPHLTQEQKEQSMASFNNPYLTLEAKEKLIAEDTLNRQKMEEDFERRAKEPQAPPLFDIWLKYVQEQDRRDAERAALHGYIDYEQERQGLGIDKPPSPKKRSQKENALISETGAKLEQEVKSSGIDRIAQFIQQDMWIGKVPPVSIIKPDTRVLLAGTKEGTIIKNRSRHGFTLTYSYTHDAPVELSFGIGYFGQEDIIPEAQGEITAATFEQGVKAYYVQYTIIDEVTKQRTTTRMVIPFSYAARKEEFVQRLHTIAKALTPKEIYTERIRRLYPLPTQTAA